MIKTKQNDDRNGSQTRCGTKTSKAHVPWDDPGPLKNSFLSFWKVFGGRFKFEEGPKMHPKIKDGRFWYAWGVKGPDKMISGGSPESVQKPNRILIKL